MHRKHNSIFHSLPLQHLTGQAKKYCGSTSDKDPVSKSHPIGSYKPRTEATENGPCEEEDPVPGEETAFLVPRLQGLGIPVSAGAAACPHL